MARPPLVAIMAAVALLLSVSLPGLADTSESGFDCRQLADKPRPDAAVGWLERSLMAGHCYIFRARAVRISREGVRTLALSHDIHDGIVREVASYLDGPPVVYERRGRIVRSGLAESVQGGSVPAPLSRIEQHYRLTLDGEERIAGRRSVRLDIEPLDNLRYGHRLWLDVETALPLKQVLLGVDGRILETFQMTELIRPRLYQQKVAFETLHDARPTGPWRPEWLPAGYELSPLPVSHGGAPPSSLGHRLYSDGLSSFSLFVEPLTDADKALLPGVHRLGISHAAVRHLRLGERVMQIVVMGELPPQVLGRIAAQLEYRPTDQAQEDAS